MNLLTRILIGFFLFGIFAYLLNDFRLFLRQTRDDAASKENQAGDGIQTSNKSQAPRPEKKEQSYHPTGKEIDLLRALVKDDLTGYAEGRKHAKSLNWEGKYPAVFVTADTLQMEYEQNEVAADRKYRNKDLFISGVVASIDRGIGENYYLQLMGGSDMFMHPHANMADGLIDYLAGLEKGQGVNLFCKGDGLLIGSAILTQCIPTSIWVQKGSDDYIKDIDNKIEAGDKGSLALSVFATALHSLLPESSSCYSPKMDKQCLSELKEYLGSKEWKEALLVSAKKYGKDALFISEAFPQAFQKNAADSQQGPVEGSPEPAKEGTLGSGPRDHTQTLKSPSATAPPQRDGASGRWVEVPAESVGGKWVPQHTVWVPANPAQTHGSDRVGGYVGP